MFGKRRIKDNIPEVCGIKRLVSLQWIKNTSKYNKKKLHPSTTAVERDRMTSSNQDKRYDVITKLREGSQWRAR